MLANVVEGIRLGFRVIGLKTVIVVRMLDRVILVGDGIMLIL